MKFRLLPWLPDKALIKWLFALMIIATVLLGCGLYWQTHGILSLTSVYSLYLALLIFTALLGAVLCLALWVIRRFKDIDTPMFLALFWVFGAYFGAIEFFTAIYGVLEAADVHFFNEPLDSFAVFYFSVTTIATVGFGDIYPTKTLSRFVVCTEIWAGVFFNVSLFAVFATYLGERMVARSKRD